MLKKIAQDIKKYKSVYLMAVPVLLFYIIFCYVPMAGVVLAFKDFSYTKGIFGSDWAGLKHFERLFSSNSFYEILRNTIVISLYRLVFSFPMPVIFALLLNEIKSMRFKRCVQTISYLPHFISWVVMGGIIAELLSPSRGVVNYLLGLFGRDPVYFLAEPAYFRGVLVVTDIWKSVGWGSIIYLSAMSSIDPGLYEAAEIDGAGRFRKMWHVTLPQISPTIIILFIFAVGGLMASGHEKIILLYNSLTYETADVIASYVYRRGLQEASYSFATAVGLISSAVNFLLLWFTNRVSKKYSEISIF